MRIYIDDLDVRRDIQNLKRTIPEAAVAAGRAALRELAERLKARILEMIPDDGGWYDIYRQSIQLIEINPDYYELTTSIQEVSFGQIEAESSLIWLSGKDDVSTVVAQYNPWTLDTIPAVKGGLNCTLVIKPASESEVEHYRRVQLSQRKSVERLIKRVGGHVHPLDAELPVINGRILADVPFLARRLENGLGGFPRTPIWSRLDAEGDTISRDESIHRLGHRTFDQGVWPKE